MVNPTRSTRHPTPYTRHPKFWCAGVLLWAAVGGCSAGSDTGRLAEEMERPEIAAPRGAQAERWLELHRLETDRSLPGLSLREKRVIHDRLAGYLAAPDGDAPSRLKAISILGQLEGLPEVRSTLARAFAGQKSDRPRRDLARAWAQHVREPLTPEERDLLETLLRSSERKTRHTAFRAIEQAKLVEFLPRLKRIQADSASRWERQHVMLLIRHLEKP